MNNEIVTLRSNLHDTLLAIDAIGNPLEKVTKATIAIEASIVQLNQFLEKHAFANDAEEIDFFKNVKAGILALKIEEVFRYHLSVDKPIGTPDTQIRYLEEQLHALQTFFKMNAYHYQYFKNNMSELDGLFFLRDAAPLAVPLAEITEIDAEFSTPMTFLFAKFIAYECLQYDILEQIAAIKYPDVVQPLSKTGDVSKLRWTGGVINLVELIYGLFLTGQLNDGNASLKQVVRWMEIHLHVNIGIIQKKLSEIERRKRLSLTKFIDQMKDAITAKIESGLN